MGQKKVQRTKQLEKMVKTAVFNEMIQEEIQQAQFDNLVRRGVIVAESEKK